MRARAAATATHRPRQHRAAPERRAFSDSCGSHLRWRPTPRAPLARPCAPLAVADAAESVEPVTLQGEETILLVEDQDEVRRVARQLMRRYGYHVLDARNAGERCSSVNVTRGTSTCS